MTDPMRESRSRAIEIAEVIEMYYYNTSPHLRSTTELGEKIHQSLPSEQTWSYEDGLRAVQTYLRGAYQTSAKGADVLDALEAFIENELHAAGQDSRPKEGAVAAGPAAPPAPAAPDAKSGASGGAELRFQRKPK